MLQIFPLKWIQLYVNIHVWDYTLSMSNPAGTRILNGSSRGKVSIIRFLHALSHPSSSNPSCKFKRSLSSLMAGVASLFKISVCTKMIHLEQKHTSLSSNRQDNFKRKGCQCGEKWNFLEISTSFVCEMQILLYTKKKCKIFSWVQIRSCISFQAVRNDISSEGESIFLWDCLLL